jgi:hypothetical protein
MRSSRKATIGETHTLKQARDGLDGGGDKASRRRGNTRETKKSCQSAERKSKTTPRTEDDNAELPSCALHALACVCVGPCFAPCLR